MALQWRIRHKLMLGLTLVVGIMALLLGGTLRGLWSYYQTVNTIRGLGFELRAGEGVKASVEDLKRAIDAKYVFDQPVAAQPATDRNGKTADGPSTRPPAISPTAAFAALDKSLSDYYARRDEGRDHDHTPGYWEQVVDYSGKIEAKVGALKQAVRELDSSSDMAINRPDLLQNDPKWCKVQELLNAIDVLTSDLLLTIYDDLSKNVDGSRSHYQGALWMIVPASVIGFLLVCGLMASFYSWVFNPIRDLQEGVKRVAAGDLDHRIELHSGDEMEELGVAFNEMMQKLQDLYSDLARQVNERSRQLVRSERLASVGFLAAGVAHEINNPLASIAFCSEALEARLQSLTRLLHDNVHPEEIEVFAKYLKMIQEEAFRCKNITERLLAFSRTGEVKREPADLGLLIQSVIDIAQHLPNSKGKDITFVTFAERVPGGRIVAPVNAEEIKSVVLNLVVNALDSLEEGGKLAIRLGQRDGLAEMQFTDSGCGMSQEVLENIFEPFFTRSRTGKGTGLGLTISHRIINQHGGELDASSAGPNQGSTFTVRLPVQLAEADAALAKAA